MRRVVCAIFVFILAFSSGCDVVDDDDSSVEEDDRTITGTVMLISAYTPDYIRPLNGAIISPLPETEPVKSDVDGRFGVNAPNDKYRLTVEGKEGESGFTTWLEVSDEFHPDITVPLREFDEGIVVYEAMLTDAETDTIDGAYAATIFPSDTRKVYLLMDHSPMDTEDMVDIVWFKDGEEVDRMEDVDLLLLTIFSDVSVFSISSDEGMPEGYYSVQLQYRRFGSKTFEKPQTIMSLPFYVRAPEPEDLSKKKFDITVINERDESISVHLDGEFKFSLLPKFTFGNMERKDTMKDVPGGEHTITVFDDDGNLIASDTFVLDSDVTLTIKPGTFSKPGVDRLFVYAVS